MLVRLMKYFYLAILMISLLAAISYGDEQKDSDSKTKKPEPSEETRSKAVKEIEEKFGLVEDKAIIARLDEVSGRIVSVLKEDEKLKKFVFKALDEKDVNAFSLPDGHIFFFKGLLDITKTDDQLAGVMAHEMAHIIKKHSKMISNKAIPYVLGGFALALGTGEPAFVLAGDWLAAATAQSYGRKAEEEADKYSIELMTRANYDPVGMLQFMSYMIEEEKRRPELFQNYFFVHPFAYERLETLKTDIRAMGYKVPDSLYRSYLESGIETREEGDHEVIDIKFGGEILLTIAGADPDKLKERARLITNTLDSLLRSGARDFDFHIVADGNRIWIQAKGRILYEPTDLDIKNSGLEGKEFLDRILKKLKRLMWEERIKRGI